MYGFVCFYRKNFLKRLALGELNYKSLWQSVTRTLDFSNTLSWVGFIVDGKTFAQVTAIIMTMNM
jgi:hypothetical protein